MSLSPTSLSPTSLGIVADIGGTNTRVALVRDGAVDRGSIRRFANAGHPGLAAILALYLDGLAAGGARPRLTGACVAAAGPVHDGTATMTNLAWTIDAAGVAAATGAATVAVINDLQAQGHGLDRLTPGSLRAVLIPRDPPAPAAARLVVGVGTGFNAAPVHALAGGGRLVAPSECGHISLPVQGPADLALARHAAQGHGFAGVEDVVSGGGLVRLHAHVAGLARPDRAAPARPADAAAIMAAMAAGNDPVATETGRIFLRLLGTVVGDLALVHLPFGGIFLVGGVARAFGALLDGPEFAAAFLGKGRFADLMPAFAVWLIEDDYAALEGCADHLAGLARPRTPEPGMPEPGMRGQGGLASA
ncbi:MAG: glucokinase [Alphaproteobacteria bacterium HGW-Alphaproteobacteria-6]|nr:MAG: glucokinase [Alphaproteobacteria bacterium HGW-Alphaproteobacteria-6]